MLICNKIGIQSQMHAFTDNNITILLREQLLTVTQISLFTRDLNHVRY